ncbi:MAG: DNA polymerase III subunit gamma/tau, partial [Chloroflexota bacterium]
MPVLYRKWRPQSLAEVVGQPAITQTLLNALGAGKVAHAYLLSGPRGTGKTSTGRILAKAVNCLSGGRGEPCNSCAICQDITLGRSLDVIEVDAASNRGIDEIRQLREKVGFAPSQGRYKVYIIDEVHMLTEAAANALLKTLEEPPSHVIFVLATTESHKVLPTILSRCQHFAFRRLPIEAIASRLEHIAAGEGITLAPGVSRLLARGASGSLRDAENIMEQALNLYEQPLGLEQVRELLGLGVDIRARGVVGHILARQAAAGLDALAQVVADGLDLRAFHRHILEYLRGLLLVRAGSAEAVEATLEEVAEMKAVAAEVELSFLLRLTRFFAAVDSRWDGYSPLPLELALIEGLGEEAEAEVKVKEI